MFDNLVGYWGRRVITDDLLLRFGADNDIVLLNRSTTLAADTALTGVLEGTVESQGIAANSLMIANITNDGDIALYTSKGGNSQMGLWLDGSSGDVALLAASGQSVDFYVAGTKIIEIAAGTMTIGSQLIGFDGTASEGLSIDTTGAIFVSNLQTTTPWVGLNLRSNLGGNPGINRGSAVGFWSGSGGGADTEIGRISAQYENNADAKAAIRFSTYTGAALTEKWRISDVGVLTSLAAVPTNVNVIGSIIAGGGIAIGADALNNLIDDASGGSGSTALYIGNAAITVASDSRVKENISPYLRNATDLLKKIKVVEFDYLDKYRPFGGGVYTDKYVGMTAQELYKVTPWAVNTQGGKDCPQCLNGEPCEQHLPWQVNHELLTGLLVKALQEMDAKLKTLGGLHER